MSALDLSSAELAEMADPETAKVCGIYERQVAAMAAELQRRRTAWQDAAIRMTILETRTTDAVVAARNALATGLAISDGDSLNLGEPGVAAAIASLAGAILLADCAIENRKVLEEVVRL